MSCGDPACVSNPEETLYSQENCIPHSISTYFVSDVSPKIPCEWKNLWQVTQLLIRVRVLI